MSAQIPDTMLISDLLKSTGYDCPERLQDKTFEESTTGEGNISIEANKEVTISENGTTVINPSEDKDVMKKVTVNVNVPSSGGSANLEDNKKVMIIKNGTTEITPTSGKDGMKKVTVSVNVPSSGSSAFRYFDGRNSGYTGNPKGFWVIGKNQTTGAAHCLVTTISGQANDPSLYVQVIRELSSNELTIDENYRETLPEVSEDVVLAALGA